jgi:predicted ester cyclase
MTLRPLTSSPPRNSRFTTRCCPQQKGAADFKEFLTGFRAGLPVAHFTLEYVATQGDTAVFRWDATGTHAGELLGISPTGQALRWTGISVVHVADGKVVKEWGEEDALAALRQLGVIPS